VTVITPQITSRRGILPRLKRFTCRMFSGMFEFDRNLA